MAGDDMLAPLVLIILVFPVAIVTAGLIAAWLDGSPVAALGIIIIVGVAAFLRGRHKQKGEAE